MRNQVEKQLAQKQKRKGVIVPLFEDYLSNYNYDYWDEDDQEFLVELMRADKRREKERKRARVYSPSLLGGCRRRTFLSRYHAEYNVGVSKVVRPETKHLFWTGTWAHLRLQLRLHQLSKRGYLSLVGAELPVGGDGHSGTLDAVVDIKGSRYIIDFKYLNDRYFQMVADKDVSEQYKIQVADYALLHGEVDGAFLIAERKSGPTPDFPAALCEYRVSLRVNGKKVRQRIEELEQHAKAHTIPHPECTSITQAQFVSCPFRTYCRGEVRAIEEAPADSGYPKKFRIAVPKKRRVNRAR
jgi:hypothetical protein